MEQVGPERVISVISDDCANMRKGRNDFVRSRDGRYRHIFPLRCVMHAFGNFLEAIAKHSSAKEVIKKAQEIVTYFRASHIPGELSEMPRLTLVIFENV